MKIEQIEFLNEVGSAISASQDKDELLTIAENSILQVSPECNVSIIIKENINIPHIVRSNVLSPQAIEQFRIDPEHPLVKKLKSNKKSILFENSENEQELSKLLVVKTKGALLIIPLVCENKLVGAIVVNRKKFEKNEIMLLEVISHLISYSLHNYILKDEINRMSITDNLTEAYTRDHFIKRFFAELEIARSLNFSLAILLIRIDNFGKYNEKYGFSRGDTKLKEISKILREIDENKIIVGRYAPIIFSLLVKETPLVDVQVLAGKLRKIFEIVAFEEDKDIPLTLSIGISSYPENGDDETYLLHTAEKALAEAVASGGNRVKVG